MTPPRPRQRVLGTAGHIDHGKTALVRALTGIDADRLPEEKRRRITIDLGFSFLDVDGTHLALIDVPGHERFVRNMLAGATGLDLAMLVVAADDSVMPQTREHLDILRLLGLSGGLVALTKCDLAAPEWIALVEDEIRDLARGSFLEGSPIVRTSAATGMGIEELRARLGALAATSPERPDPGPFRMAIDRAFTVAGHGTVVTGTVASGIVRVGDDLEWLPEMRAVRVRGLQQHGRSVERLGRGTRAAINLVGVHHAEVHRGQELGAPGYLRPTRRLSAEVRVSPDALRPLASRSRHRLHLGTAQVLATIALLDSGAIEPGGVGLAQLSLAEPVAAVYGEPFVLRAESPPATVGGGRVLQPTARRVRRRDAAEVARIGRMGDPGPMGRAAVALMATGLDPWTTRDLVREAGLNESEAPAAIESLAAGGILVELPLGPRRSTRVPVERVADLESRILRVVGRLHEARPRLSTVRRPHIASALPDIGNEALIAAVIDRLLSRGELVGDGLAVALRDFRPRLSHAEGKLKETIAAAYRAGWLAPPDVAELTSRAGSRASLVPELLALLVDEGRLVELSHGLYLDRDAEAELRRRTAERLADGSSVVMAEFRDLLGVTRRHAVPYGEHLDRIGLTRREGDARRLASAFGDGGTAEAPTRIPSP
ncbi:selenocysteine-specific translation elongation factor [Paludisphaera soli]|uniref:selenocysteine-specific translation elongation factor n=1 Tax=Paludisphaera soli TaxID=2712865 RepID=UPI0013EE2171|nr:selenocysteine-specific translation elongation factor [Paludisphaera soli]